MCTSLAMSPTEQFIDASLVKWHVATSHPFLAAVRDGSLEGEQFDRFLGQDHIYLRQHIRFVAATLAKAPAEDIQVLAESITGCKGELQWIEEKAGQRGIDLSQQKPSHQCKQFCALVEQLHSAPYPVQLAAIWAQERVFYEAFSNLGTLEQPAYQECADRWGSPEFGRFVEQLQQHADRALNAADDTGLWEEARQVVESIMEHEAEFWNMAYASTY